MVVTLRTPCLSAGLLLAVAAVAFGDEAAAPAVGDGVYSAAQARRGEALYEEPCGRCHGVSLNGAPDDPDMLPAPPVAGPKFLRAWDGRTLAALYRYTRTTMPAMNPGYLSDEDVVDILAYMLFVSGLPAGERALEPDLAGLARIVIQQQP